MTVRQLKEVLQKIEDDNKGDFTILIPNTDYPTRDPYPFANIAHIKKGEGDLSNFIIIDDYMTQQGRRPQNEGQTN